MPPIMGLSRVVGLFSPTQKIRASKRPSSIAGRAIFFSSSKWAIQTALRIQTIRGPFEDSRSHFIGPPLQAPAPLDLVSNSNSHATSTTNKNKGL